IEEAARRDLGYMAPGEKVFILHDAKPAPTTPAVPSEKKYRLSRSARPAASATAAFAAPAFPDARGNAGCLHEGQRPSRPRPSATRRGRREGHDARLRARQMRRRHLTQGP